MRVLRRQARNSLAARGSVLIDTRSMEPPFVFPEVMWSDGLSAHTLENTGDDDIRVHAVELK
jgi:hypothetical protein